MVVVVPRAQRRGPGGRGHRGVVAIALALFARSHHLFLQAAAAAAPDVPAAAAARVVSHPKKIVSHRQARWIDKRRLKERKY